MNKIRCKWVNLENKTYVSYHDKEWGLPLYRERKLFEFINLEGMQAGLSWLTILLKRENYRNCFDHFDAYKIARYTPAKVEKILSNPGIIRNRLKVEAIIKNARAYLEFKEKKESFSDYIWNFVEGKPINNTWKSIKFVPSTSKISERMAKDLKQQGFKFVGNTICYAFMQAVGMVNDHTIDCFRYREIAKINR